MQRQSGNAGPHPLLGRRHPPKTSLRIGGEYAIEKSRRFDFPFLSVASGGPAKPLTTLGNPNAVGIGGNNTQRLVTDFKATTLGLYAQDTIALTPY